MEDRSWYDNLRIDGFQEVDNEIWEQNERIFINGYFYTYSFSSTKILKFFVSLQRSKASFPF